MNQTKQRPVALITGAGTGLGQALARALAGDGFDVAVHYRSSKEGANQTLQAARALGVDAAMYRADLSKDKECHALAVAIQARFGRLDVLVNNAGTYTNKPGIELNEKEWLEGIHSTATQTFLTTRAMLPLLRRDKRGRVINIGDSSAERPGARDRAWSYHIGKTGVWILTRSFAAEEASHGVAVNMVSPGFLENSVGELTLGEVPAGRLGTFEDVHQAVRFLAQEAPAYLTGSNLVVSGGWNLR